MSKYLAVLLVTSLSACGMKGALQLPPGPPPEPILGNPKPAKPAAPAANDVSTDQKRSSQ